MDSLKRRFALLAIVPITLLLTPTAGEPGRLPLAFAPGEKLTYSVTWSVFDAGEVTAALQQASNGAQDDYEFVTTARSHGFVSVLYNLDDEFRSRFNPDTLCSGGISKRVVEGHRRKQTDIVFDRTRELAILDERNLAKPNEPAKHDQHPIPSCVQDVVSAFYFLRSQPMKVGDRITMPVNDGSKTTQVTVEVQAREQINTPLGRRYAFRVEPTVFGSLYKRQGRMLIWFSDDERRLPLRIKAVISVGTITGTLKSVQGSPAIGVSNGGSAAISTGDSSDAVRDGSRQNQPSAAKGPDRE
ncbi:MAG TPA: DUF3108 domain-containing protein [Terriglobia bacterium]